MNNAVPKPVRDMDAFTDEYGNEALVCFSCSYEYEYDFGWLDDRMNLSLRVTLDRLLWD